jgi:hypothetical protein
MMTTVQIIQTICPDLADSPSMSQFVQMASEGLNSRFFGKLFNQAVAYKACHLFTITTGDKTGIHSMGGTGSVTSYAEGGINIGFSASQSDSELATTKYGKMLLDLMKSCPKMDVNKNCMPSFPVIL